MCVGNGIIKKTKEMVKAYMRTDTSKVSRMEVVPARVQRAGRTNTKSGVAKAVGQGSREEVFSLALTLPCVEQSWKSSTNLHVPLRVSGWEDGMGDAWTRQVWEATSWTKVRGPAGAVFCEMKGFGVTVRSWKEVQRTIKRAELCACTMAVASFVLPPSTLTKCAFLMGCDALDRSEHLRIHGHNFGSG